MHALLIVVALLATRIDRSIEPRDTSNVQTEGRQLEVMLGGALRYNYVYRDWDRESRAGGGTFDFDTFRLNADATYGRLSLQAEYRFYSGYHMLKTGSVAYRFSESFSIRTGVFQVPFGITEYASNSWFFQLPYYLGLEDDHDAGLGVTWDDGRFAIEAAFFKNSEGPFTGRSLSSARYSYDVVPAAAGELDYGSAPVAEARHNREINQANIKLLQRLITGATSIAYGISLQHGGLRNAATRETGSHSAGALHVDVTHRGFNAKLQAIGYRHDPRNPEGHDSRFVVFGAYDAPYKVAASGWIYGAALSYHRPVVWGPISGLNIYNDFGYLRKDIAGYRDSQQNITGISLAAGPLFTYLDLLVARNHPFAIPGHDFAAALAEGSDEWHARFNVNVGVYF